MNSQQGYIGYVVGGMATITLCERGCYVGSPTETHLLGGFDTPEDATQLALLPGIHTLKSNWVEMCEHIVEVAVQTKVKIEQTAARRPITSSLRIIKVDGHEYVTPVTLPWTELLPCIREGETKANGIYIYHDRYSLSEGERGWHFVNADVEGPYPQEVPLHQLLADRSPKHLSLIHI